MPSSYHPDYLRESAYLDLIRHGYDHATSEQLAQQIREILHGQADLLDAMRDPSPATRPLWPSLSPTP